MRTNRIGTRRHLTVLPSSVEPSPTERTVWSGDDTSYAAKVRRSRALVAAVNRRYGVTPSCARPRLVVLQGGAR